LDRADPRNPRIPARPGSAARARRRV